MKPELEVRHLRVFLAVIEAGGHTRAARSLGLSQSTVSETLMALERTLGTALFQKVARGVTLTPAGEALLPYARRILALTGEAVTELARVSTEVSARLVVAAVESVSAYVLPARLAALRERWPSAQLEVITGVCAEIRERVAAGGCDLGLLETDTASPDPTVIARTRLVICSAPRHPLAGRPASADQLRRHDFYMCDGAGNYHQVLRQYFEAAQLPPPRTQSLGTIDGVKRGVEAGGTALGLLPAHAVGRELHDGLLTELHVSPPLPGLALRAVVASGGAGSPMVEQLLRDLRSAPLGI